ncbi:hypothetical protein KP509_07G086600 [Ceratopteris richardii]|uniref:F-box domain-containing protein n=1 Tax=Ceratopteris richardii TaxID=49495 RepID=A0A8T2UEA2_CERRI|nr:hypothetical protein KP509_07G086600 [Ceratopteris richardii]
MEHLTQDMLFNITSKLSAYDVVRLACSCRGLRAQLASAATRSTISFLENVRPHMWLPPLFRARVYDPDCEASLVLPSKSLFMDCDLLDDEPIIASDGGLLCIGCQRKGDAIIIIFNPLTRTSKQIKMEELLVNVEALGLQYKGAADGYVLFALLHFEGWRLLRYCSTTQQWCDILSSPLIPPDGYRLECKTITCCDSILYTLWRKTKHLKMFAHGSDGWKEVDLPFRVPRRRVRIYAFLMDFGSLLHLAVLQHQQTHWLDVCIWKLHQHGRFWEAVARMPEIYVEVFSSRVKPLRGVHCVGKNGVLYMKSPAKVEPWVLMYDMSNDRWSWTERGHPYMSTVALVFEPSLAATP